MSSRASDAVGAHFSDQKTPTILKLKLNEEAMRSNNSKRIWVPGPLIIGAGPSGLAIAACLKEKGVPSLILEKENCIASSWRMRTYERLKLHLPKHLCELPLMPFPSDFPVYPTKQQFISYLDSYIKRFSIRPFFGMEVWKAEYDKNIEFWRINAGDDWEFICRWLIVASGENAEAKVPEIPGMAEFKGRILHTSRYKKGDDFRGERVLVIGCGNSGMEVCLDLCNNHARASMVVRDEVSSPLLSLLNYHYSLSLSNNPMGNCSLRPPVNWADDELDGFDVDDDDSDDRKGEKSPARMSASSTKVRIRINKKQLQELLRRAQVKRISILDLIRIGEVSFGGIQMQYWRPALQSIPEEYDQSL